MAHLTYEAYLDEVTTILTELYELDDAAAIKLVVDAQEDSSFPPHDDHPEMCTIEQAQKDAVALSRRKKASCKPRKNSSNVRKKRKRNPGSLIAVQRYTFGDTVTFRLLDRAQQTLQGMHDSFDRRTVPCLSPAKHQPLGMRVIALGPAEAHRADRFARHRATRPGDAGSRETYVRIAVGQCAHRHRFGDFFADGAVLGEHGQAGTSSISLVFEALE